MSRKINEILDQYFLPREVLAANTKSDGNVYHIYRAWLKQEYWRNQTPACYIIKEISEAQSTFYKALSQIRHPNIEIIYHVFECEGCFYAVNEYINPPSLPFGPSYRDFTTDSLSLERYFRDYNGNLPGKALSYEEQVRQALLIVLQLGYALKYIQKMGFIHGDIHPGNILLTDILMDCPPNLKETCGFSVKLIDFDNAQIAKQSDHAVTHIIGTKPFAAPELLDFTHPLNRADIYSLGCILYYAIYGSSPKDISLNEQKIRHKWANRIFRRCTASYEARYKNMDSLIKDLQRALWIPSGPISAFVYRLPGFRTHTVWKMAVACYFYSCLLISVGTTFLLISQHGLPLQEDEIGMLMTTSLLLLEVILLCDAFRIGEHFESYLYFKNAHPVLNFILKIGLGLFVFFLYILFFSMV